MGQERAAWVGQPRKQDDAVHSAGGEAPAHRFATEGVPGDRPRTITGVSVRCGGLGPAAAPVG